MMKRLLCLLLVLLMPLAALADTQADPSPHAELDAAVDGILKKYKAVGAAVVVARQGEIVYHHDYGWRDKRDKLPVTPDTYFKTASVTKMICAVRIMQLVEQGRLSLDAPIGAYLGFVVYNPRYPDTPVTLRHLMSHTSSLKSSYSMSRPLDQFLDAALGKTSYWNKWAPGSRFEYSNLAAGLMGPLMEIVEAQDVNSCMEEGLWGPMGLDAAFRVHLLDVPENHALRYDASGKLSRARSFYLNEAWDDFPDPMNHYKITIGDVWIRADDLCRIGMMLCAGGEWQGRDILSGESVALMKDTVMADSPYGLCVERTDTLLVGRTVYGHQGRSDGILCGLYWEEESGFVIAVMTNGSSTAQEGRIAKLTRRVFEQVWPVFGDGCALAE